MFRKGLLSPTLTPVKADLSIDMDRFAAHVRWLLARGCHGVVLFGTTGEATSFSADERREALDGLVARGVPAQRLMVGIGTCSIPETAALGRHALDIGTQDLLILPPFYYKNPPEDGLVAHFEAVVERLGRTDADLHLYHIPPVAGVGFSVELVGRLRERIPAIVGIKDSSGDWQNTAELIRAHEGLSVFCGSEPFLLETLRAGGAGCITATANVNAANIRELYDHWQAADAETRQASLTDFRKRVQGFNPIPAMKALLAQERGESVWRNVRPPFQPLPEERLKELQAQLQAGTLGVPDMCM